MKNTPWVMVRRLCLCLLSIWLATAGLACAPARAVGPPPGLGQLAASAARPEPQLELALSQSIPQGLALAEPELPAAAEVWRALFQGARSHIEIAQFYVQSEPGEAMAPILDELLAAGRRGVRVRVLLSSTMKGNDVASQERLKAAPGVEVRYLNLARTGGILHAKYLLVDDELLYVGSQNFDWRSLTQIHELGVRVRSRPLAGQLGAIFALDWELAAAPAGEPPAQAAASAPGESSLPAAAVSAPSEPSLPAAAASAPGVSAVPAAAPASALPLPAAQPGPPPASPLPAAQPGPPPEVELVASPPSLLPPGTRPAIAALVELLRGARRSVHVQLLKYTPYPFRSPTVWPVIDAELRAAAARGVKVRLLVSNWNTSRPAIDHLKELSQLPGIEVRIATVPELPGRFIPFARVVHSKYLIVDEQILWVGTANWEPGMFLGCRNIELVIRRPALAAQGERIFGKLWDSPYALAVDPQREYVPPRIK